MLDFVKAMEIAKSICSQFGGENDNCACCVLNSEFEICAMEFPHDNGWDYQKIVDTLLAWDKAHPEPQYPTWEEWQKENFPDAHNRIIPCAFRPCLGQCKGFDGCRKQPIPDDIAKKLGIKPKEGAN